MRRQVVQNKRTIPETAPSIARKITLINMASQFQPVCLADFEKFAYETLPRNALDYYRSGANNQETLEDNVKAFIRYDISTKVGFAVYQVD